MPGTDPLTFLSEEWFAALEAAANATAEVGDALVGDCVVVRHEVTACPPDGRRVVYTVRGTPAGTAVRTVRGDGDVQEPVTASFHTSYDAAREALLGAANAQQLILDGRLRVHGELDALARHGPWFDALARSWTSVRERTIP